MNRIIAASFFIISLSVVAWCDQQENERLKARRELGQLGLQYTWQDFVRSIENKDRLAVDLFLAAGMSIEIQDSRRGTPLMYMAARGNVEGARLLVDRGANVNAKTEKGWTVLMQAAQYGHPEIVKLLLDKGARVSEVNSSGDTALDVVSRNRLTSVGEKEHAEVIDLLTQAERKIGLPP
jgi:hypothetical protein